MRVRLLVVVLLLLPVFLFSEDPPCPIFENISIPCSVAYAPDQYGNIYYTYQYFGTNPISNTVAISSFSIPIDSVDDVIFPPPDPDIPTARGYYENYCYVSLLNPIEWTPSTTNFCPPYPFVNIGAFLKPGRTNTLNPCNVRSYRPPTIKILWVYPHLYDYFEALAVARGLGEEDYMDTRDIELSYIRKIPSLGPYSGSLWSFEHWDALISDVAKAREIGWVYDNSLWTTIDQKLRAGRQAAYDGDLEAVNSRLSEVITLIQNSTVSQRKDEFYYLVYYNADTLRDNIPYPCEPKLTATPDYGRHSLGELHQIEATLINQSNGQPLADEPITMEVISGPNVGITQEAITNAQGKALLSYTGYYEGTDEIEVRTKEGTFSEKKGQKVPTTVKGALAKSDSTKVETKFRESQNMNKTKLSKKQRKTLESDCTASDKRIRGLFVEWKGYTDLGLMLAPKKLKVKGGQTIYLFASVCNFGNITSPPTSVRFYICSAPPNSDPSPEMTLLTELAIESLEKGKSSFCKAAVVIPGSFAEGDYYFEACVDPDNLIVEKDEWNNCGYSTASTIAVLTSVENPNTPPDCSKAVANPGKLWPPNHKLSSIQIQGVADPDGDGVTLAVTSITQDEPVNGQGDGDTSPDGFGVGTSNPQVRAERSGMGNGRVYRINFKATDAKGGECTGFVTVGVPHDKKDTPIDDGQNYDSTKP